MSQSDQSPTRAQLLDLLETLELVLGDIMRRWQDGIPPEVREEVMLRAYEPVLHMLIRSRRRPKPR